MIVWFLRNLFTSTAEITSGGGTFDVPPFVAGILFAVFAIFVTQRGIVYPNSPPPPPALQESEKITSREGEKDKVTKSMGEKVVMDKNEGVTKSMGEGMKEEEVIEKKVVEKVSNSGLHDDSELEGRGGDVVGGRGKKKDKGMTVGEWHERRAWFRYSLSTFFYLIVGGAIIYEVGRITKTTQSDFFDYFSMIFPRESDLLLRLMTRRRT